MFCGATGNRTPDLLLAKQALYQLSYGPDFSTEYGRYQNESGTAWGYRDLNLGPLHYQ